jgi:hypothetical protein
MQSHTEVHKARFIYGCDLKVGDVVVVQGRPYPITEVEDTPSGYIAYSGTWSMVIRTDEVVQISMT